MPDLLSARILDDFGDLQREMPGRALHAANVVADSVRAAAPVRTGYLRDSVAVTPTPDGAVIEVGAYYGAYVDQGTSRMSARPFFQVTIDRMDGQVQEIIFGGK